MKKKNLIFTGIIGLSAVAFAATLAPSAAYSSIFATQIGSSECNWNHYTSKDPFKTDYGYREYWACCVHHEISLTEPSEGRITSATNPNLDSVISGSESNDAYLKAPWAHADFAKASEIKMASNVNNIGYTPTFTKSATEITYKGYYNGGIRIDTTGAAEGRNILSITLIGSNVSWGVNQYIRAYTDFTGQGQVLPCVQLYNTAGVNKWIENGGKIYDAAGNSITSLTKNAQFTLEMDLTKYLTNGKSVKCIDLWSGYSDSDVESGYANVPTITVKDVTFKETYCGHSLADYEEKSTEKIDEFTSKSTWKECKKCGEILGYINEVPVGKERIDLNNYASNVGIIQVVGNTLVSDQTGGSTSSTIAYNIPSRFEGRGKLVVRLRLNKVFNGFDIRLSKKDGTNLAYNFGQLNDTETPLNKGFAGVTAITESLATTATKSSTPLNEFITYTFDLSSSNLTSSQVVKFSLWYGQQYLEIDQFYFMDNCAHESGETTIVVTEKTANTDGSTINYCNECGQAVESTYDYVDKMAINLPESIVLGNSAGNEYYYSNIIEHESPRTKLVIKMSVEVLNGGTWEYIKDNYGTYITFLKQGKTKLPLGLYEATKTEQTTFIQMNSNSGKDARVLRPDLETQAAYIMPSYIKASINNKIITWEIDLTDSTMQNLYGFAFRNSLANSRLHILEAYQEKPSI